MAEMNIGMSDGNLTCFITIKEGETVNFNAAELDIIIRHLAVIRSQMIPLHSSEELSQETIVSEMSNMRWFFGPHPIETQARLAIMHPGYGWISIPMGRTELEKMNTAMNDALTRLPKLQ